MGGILEIAVPIFVAAAEGAAIGGGIDAAVSAVEGKNPLKGFEQGAEFGGISGLGAGAGGLIGAGFDTAGETFGATSGSVLGGALGGAGISAAQGANPLTGALEGGVGGYLQSPESPFASSPTDNTATSGAGNTPSIAASESAASPSPTGGFTSPSGVSNLASQDINQALSPGSLSGQALSTPTQLGDITSSSLATPPSPGQGVNFTGDPANLGPVNSTPSISSSAPSNFDVSAPAGVSAPPLESGLNTGQGPTVAAAANLTPPTSSGSILSNVGNFLTNSKNLPSLLGVGFTGLEELQGPPPLPASGKALASQGNELNAAASADLARAQAGEVTAPQQATINQYIQNAQNQLYQQLASEGITNPQQDTRFIQGMQQIQQQAQAMTQQYIQQTFTNAMGEAGQAASDLGAATNAATANDTAFSQALSSAVGSIGGMYTLQNLGKAA